MKKIIIPYFPTGMKYTTPLPLGLAIYLLTTDHPVWAGILALLTIIIWTTNYVTVIDIHKKQSRDFLSFLGLHLQEETIKFTKVDKIIITKDNHSQMLNSRSRSRQLDWASFTGTLLFDNSKTLDLLTKNNKGQLIKGLKEFSDFLKVEIEDQSTNRHYIVDTNRI